MRSSSSFYFRPSRTVETLQTLEITRVGEEKFLSEKSFETISLNCCESDLSENLLVALVKHQKLIICLNEKVLIFSPEIITWSNKLLAHKFLYISFLIHPLYSLHGLLLEMLYFNYIPFEVLCMSLQWLMSFWKSHQITWSCEIWMSGNIIAK